MIIPHPYGDVYIDASAVVAILPIRPRGLTLEGSFQILLRGREKPMLFSYGSLEEAKKARESAMSAFFKDDKKGYANDC